MDTSATDPLIGALVGGRYRILARVARGGMATVYTATDERLTRTVALKVIHPGQADDVNFVDRFMDEAKTIARLTHPNVVAVYDQGTHDSLPYLVMEYIRGRTLRDLLVEKGRLSATDALAVLEHMLAAIAAAHRAGLVHRDVKPENVLVAEAPSSTSSLADSVVKVADFGLAKAVEASAESGTGHLMATAAYVAPELVADGHADPRSDVYSAGIVLFEMLTGQVPYQGTQAVQVAWQHVEQDVPAPSGLTHGVPASVDALVRSATRRDPAARPTDAGAMLAQVQAIREELHTATAGNAAGQTMLVPKIDASATTVLGRDAIRSAGRTQQRPSWARLPSERTQPRPPAGWGGNPAPTYGGTGQPSPVYGGNTPPTYGGNGGVGQQRGGAHGRQHHGAGRGNWQGQPGPPNRQGGPATLLARLKRDPKARLAAVAGLVTVCLLLTVGIWWFGAGRYTTAPTLIGTPKQEAVAKAKQGGFSIRFGVDRYDEAVPKDTVLDQNPKAGDRMVSGGTITIVISRGQERYQVPDISGKPFDLAVKDLAPFRPDVKRVDKFDDNIPQGNVISTDPASGSDIKPGSAITVAVSKGRAPITVPSVIGKNVQEAKQTMSRLKLTVEVVNQDSDKPKDQVINQDPADGSGAEAGGKVTLTVSNGPAMAVVPDLNGRNVQDATQALQAIGLQAQVFGFGSTVRGQSPSANSQVNPGSQVTLFVSP